MKNKLMATFLSVFILMANTSVGFGFGFPDHFVLMQYVVKVDIQDLRREYINIVSTAVNRTLETDEDGTLNLTDGEKIDYTDEERTRLEEIKEEIARLKPLSRK